LEKVVSNEGSERRARDRPYIHTLDQTEARSVGKRTTDVEKNVPRLVHPEEFPDELPEVNPRIGRIIERELATIPLPFGIAHLHRKVCRKQRIVNFEFFNHANKFQNSLFCATLLLTNASALTSSCALLNSICVSAGLAFEYNLFGANLGRAQPRQRPRLSSSF
jgi:hypothetical protein